MPQQSKFFSMANWYGSAKTFPSPQPLSRRAKDFSPFSVRDKGTLAAEQKGRGERSEGAEGGKLLNRLSMLTTRMAFNIQRIASVMPQAAHSHPA